MAAELTRHGFLAGGLGSVVLFGLAGCSVDTPAEAPGPPTSRAVQHKYGTAPVPAAPQRVVTLGYTDHEPVLALGVRPVGVVDFFGERPYGNWPWETPLWNGARRRSSASVTSTTWRRSRPCGPT